MSDPIVIAAEFADPVIAARMADPLPLLAEFAEPLSIVLVMRRPRAVGFGDQVVGEDDETVGE